MRRPVHIAAAVVGLAGIGLWPILTLPAGGDWGYVRLFQALCMTVAGFSRGRLPLQFSLNNCRQILVMAACPEQCGVLPLVCHPRLHLHPAGNCHRNLHAHLGGARLVHQGRRAGSLISSLPWVCLTSWMLLHASSSCVETTTGDSVPQLRGFAMPSLQFITGQTFTELVDKSFRGGSRHGSKHGAGWGYHT